MRHGEWKVRLVSREKDGYVAYVWVDKPRNTYLVASVCSDSMALNDTIKNATLVATAPELLVALKNLMWRFDDADEDANEPEETSPDILSARKAIAKAEGRE